MFLEWCAERNHWANGGPLWDELAKQFQQHMRLDARQALVPCSSGGIALEAMARLWQQRLGRPLRWAIPSFSFRNLGRGWFAGALVVDCDQDGMIDVEALDDPGPGRYDGIIAVNPLGAATSFASVIAFAQDRGVPLIIDNAAGLGPEVPDHDWQTFSLHHTKPYGMGEGGLALLPAEATEAFKALIGYGDLPDPPSIWLNNGKISDISCAFLLDRLQDAADWSQAYATQRQRILALAAEFGLLPLPGVASATCPLTSVALQSATGIAPENLKNTRHFVPAKYYQPIAPTPTATALFAKLVNIPAHPTMARLSDDQIREDLGHLTRV